VDGLELVRLSRRFYASRGYACACHVRCCHRCRFVWAGVSQDRDATACAARGMCDPDGNSIKFVYPTRIPGFSGTMAAPDLFQDDCVAPVMRLPRSLACRVQSFGKRFGNARLHR
jgi:hypothetical protein